MKLKNLVAYVLVALMVLAVVPASAAVTTLREGAKSDDVYVLQKALSHQKYYKGDFTGVYDQKTIDAVKAFQKAKKLKVDGLAGHKTFAALGIASDDKVQGTGEVKVDGSGLYMRSGPSTSYNDLIKLKDGTKVYIIGESGSWYKIRLSGGAEGYVYKSYVKTQTSSSSTQTQTGKVKVDTKLTVRSGAGTSYDAKGYLKNGAVVSITENKNGWYKIRTSTGLEGYCSAEYITITNGTVVSKIKKPTQKLTKGMENNDVVLLQERLKELGYFNNQCTGYFGSITFSAVKAFQKANNLTVDGIAGPKTLDALFSDKAIPKKENAPKEPSDAVKDKIEDLIAYAMTFLGTPYKLGANGPDKFDCTGFTCYVFKHFGYSIPRSSYSQGYTDYGIKITNKSDLKRGDLVFFDTVKDNDKSDHAGIYLGDGKFIHASSGKSMSVVIGDINSSYYIPRFSWGRRVIY